MVYKVLTQEDSSHEPFGDSHSLNERPYPSWWPGAWNHRGSNRLEMLYGFPGLSFWSIETEKDLHWKKMPPINLLNFSRPTQSILDLFPEIYTLSIKWRKASTFPWALRDRKPGSDWLEEIGTPAAQFWDKNSNLLIPWLVDGCPQTLNYFGVKTNWHDELVYNDKSPFFKTPLIYYPGKWILMVYMSILILIGRNLQFVHYGLWKGLPMDMVNYEPFFTEKNSFVNFLSPLVSGDKKKIISLWKEIHDKHSLIRDNADSDGNLVNNLKALLTYFDGFKILFHFIQFYELQGGFVGLKEHHVLQMFAHPDFLILMKTLLGFLNDHERLPLDARIFLISKIDIYGINSNPYVNWVTTVNWFIYLLFTLNWELSDKRFHPYFDEIYTPISLSNNFPNNMFEGYKKQILLAISREKKETIEQAGQETIEDHFGNIIGSNDFVENGRTVILDPQLDPLVLWLNAYRIAWRNTATWSYSKKSQPVWPPEYLLKSNEVSSLEQGSIYYQFVYFICQDYPPPRLKVPPINLITFSRKDNHWEEVFVNQFKDYITWAWLNVNARSKEGYALPGQSLLSPKGEHVINTFPSYQILDIERSHTLYNISQIAIPIVTFAADFTFGDDYRDYLDDAALTIWENVQKILKEIWNFVKEVAKEIAFPVGEIALILGGLFLGGTIFKDFLESKIISKSIK